MSVGEVQQRIFNCLNCQNQMRLDPSMKKLEDDKKKVVDPEFCEGLEGQSLNLLKVICNADIPSNVPVCKDCSNELMRDMDHQLGSREEDYKAYGRLLQDLKDSSVGADLSALRLSYSTLKDEEQNLQAELKQILAKDKALDDELTVQKRTLEQACQQETQLWNTFRNNHKNLLDLGEQTSTIDAELRYAEKQHAKLSATNVLDLCFHIWVDAADGTIGEINGLRLGRLPEPEKQVEWLEINAAWGQLVLLLDVLMQRVNVKVDGFRLEPMGSNSSIRALKASGVEQCYPLFSSGSWRPFGNHNIDSGILAFLRCFEELCNELKKQDPNFRLTYRIHKDSLISNGASYSLKMWLNSEERWTRAMKMLLTNIKAALVQVAALRSSN